MWRFDFYEGCCFINEMNEVDNIAQKPLPYNTKSFAIWPELPSLCESGYSIPSSKDIRSIVDAQRPIVEAKHDPLRLELFLNVRNDDAPKVLQHVADGTDIELIGEALRYAAQRGSSSVVRELVALGINVDTVDRKTGCTALHLAASAGNCGVCDILFDALADVTKTVDGLDVMAIAVKYGHEDVETSLRSHLAAMSAQDEKGNPTTRPVGAPLRTQVLPRMAPAIAKVVMQAVSGQDEASA